MAGTFGGAAGAQTRAGPAVAPPLSHPAFAAFTSWARQYQSLAAAGARADGAAEGVVLAGQRRVALRELIQSDPAQALAMTLPVAVRQTLPAEVANQLEVNVSGVGDFAVLCALTPSGGRLAGSIQRRVSLEGRTYRAFVYGRGLGRISQRGILLQGIAIDDVLALDEEALGDKDRRPLDLDPSRTLGPKKVLIIRVDFADLPGDPGNGVYTAAYVQQMMDTQISPFFERSSYGRTSLKSTTTTQLYRMPHSASYYATGPNDLGALSADAEAAAGSDYALRHYDRVLTLFPSLTAIPGSRITYGGLAVVSGREVWINGEFTFRVLTHELGHTYGLWHANGWEVSDGNPINDAGWSSEYGDVFDTMGGGNDPRADFNPCLKCALHWLDEEQVQRVTASGLYRIHRFDHATATGTLALKVAKDEKRDYWISCRRSFADNLSMQHGAYIVWGYPFGILETDLLDLTTPGTNVKDAALSIGASLVDPAGGVTISPVAEGGVTPKEYLDVRITFGQVPPIFTAAPETQMVAPGQTAIFIVRAAGIPPPGFQWERQPAGSSAWTALNDGEDYVGCTTSTLMVRSPTLLMHGDQFRCVISNPVGSVTSSPPAELRVVTSGVVTLVGEAGSPGYADGVGKLARFNQPHGLALDSAGYLYVADSYNCVIRKISPAGSVSTLAGLARSFGSADGLGSQARFNCPAGLAVDALGNIYVADTGNHTIRKITPEGLVTTLAGLAGNPGSADGSGRQARFYSPTGIALDTLGDLYVADQRNCTIRRITPEGTVSTVAGTAGKAGDNDGIGSEARFNCPAGIAVDSRHNLFVTDQGFSTIRKLAPGGVVGALAQAVSTFAGVAAAVGAADGRGSKARFYGPAGVAVDASDTLYVADQDNDILRQVTPDAEVSTLVGRALNAGSADGLGNQALFSGPYGVATDGKGKIYISDTYNNTVRLLQISPVAQPELQITFSGNQLVLSWPRWARDFVLERSRVLNSPNSWMPFSNGTARSGASFVLTNTLEPEAGFYRLRRQR